LLLRDGGGRDLGEFAVYRRSKKAAEKLLKLSSAVKAICLRA